MLNDITQEQATAGVLDYARMIGRQLPDGARLAPEGVAGTGPGTLKCFGPDGNDLTGQVFVVAQYSIEGVDRDREPDVVDRLRTTWEGLGYRLIDDPQYQNGDRVPTYATPGDDYHLTIWLYGDHRSVPLIVIESPCAWPDPAPTASSATR